MGFNFQTIKRFEFIKTIFMIIYSIQSCIWMLFKIKESKIEIYFVGTYLLKL